jgi:two-component system, NtrC family, sensor histidine kinase HydH
VPRMILIAVAVLAVTLGHYTIPPVHGGVHDLMQRVYYLPIVLAGFWYGLRGGLLTALAVGLLYLPHIFLHWGGAHHGNVEKFLELVLYLVVGGVTGGLADRLRAANRGLVGAYESLREKSNLLLAAEEQLGQAQRLAALGELSAELAHEIRNPLGAIKGSAEIFRDRLPAGDPLREFALILCREADRLNAVLEGCLEMARRGQPREGADPVAAVREVVELTAVQAQRAGVRLSVRLPERLPAVTATAGSLRQVFLNLTLNAIQAMPRGGELTVEGGCTRKEVQLRFSDTGVGLSPQQLERAFQPFFTSRERGTGLGLTIAQRLIAGAGGRIEVSSEQGRGAVFTLSFPMRVEQEAA